MARITGAIAAVILACGAATASMAPAAARAASTTSAKAALPAHGVPVAAAGLAAPPTARAGQRSSPAAGGNDDYFNSDSCHGSTFCMAVGGYDLGAASPGLSEMLTGGTWLAEPVPAPASGPNVFANEVSCASATSCLFVGSHWAGQNGPARNLAEFWNGQSWRIVAASGLDASGLGDVACPTARFCLAVGDGGPARTFRATAYTWTNGTTWRWVTVPHPAHARNSQLSGLACYSSANCMAVGNYTTESGRNLPFAVHWHSAHWTLLTTPAVSGQRDSYFQGISCPTATRCMAVGQTVDNTSNRYYHAFAEIWSGGKWRVSTLRKPPSVFNGISCPERNRCFAAGYTFPSPTGYAHSLIETWTGKRWTTQHTGSTPLPYPGGDLLHVSCVSGSDCETVGERFQPAGAQNTQTLALSWNGSNWTVQTTVNP